MGVHDESIIAYLTVAHGFARGARARLSHARALTPQAMFISLRGNPFKAELDSLQADAMGVGDLPPGLAFSPRRGLRASVPPARLQHHHSRTFSRSCGAV